MARRVYVDLTASTVATATVEAEEDREIAGRLANFKVGAVRVLGLSGDDPIFFTVNGQDPTEKGDDVFVVLTGGEVQVAIPATETASVKAISAGVALVGVEAISNAG